LYFASHLPRVFASEVDSGRSLWSKVRATIFLFSFWAHSLLSRVRARLSAPPETAMARVLMLNGLRYAASSAAV